MQDTGANMSRKQMPMARRFATATFLAFSIAGAVTGSLNEARSTWELYQRAANNYRIEYIQGAPLIYAGASSDDTDSSDEVVPILTAIAFCMTKHSFLVRHGCPFTSLTKELGGFTYVVGGARQHEDVVGTIIIERPTNPFELEELVTLLRRHTFFYAFQDGSDYFNAVNFHMGSCLA